MWDFLSLVCTSNSWKLGIVYKKTGRIHHCTFGNVRFCTRTKITYSLLPRLLYTLWHKRWNLFLRNDCIAGSVEDKDHVVSCIQHNFVVPKWLIFRKYMTNFFTPKKEKSDFFTPKEQGTFQFALIPTDEEHFTTNTLEALDNRFDLSKQIERAYPSK